MALSKHPLHPLVVHVPIGLLVTVPVWDAASLLRGAEMRAVAFWTLGAGLVAALPAIVTGALDIRKVAARSPASDTLAWHLTFVVSAVLCFGLSWVLRFEASSGSLFVAASGAAITGVALLAVGGYFGAELVFSHRVGLPAPAEPRESLRRAVYGESGALSEPPQPVPPPRAGEPSASSAHRDQR